MINNFIFKVSVTCMMACSSLLCADFTVASFNCGGLPDHYDYIRAICMGKLIQERYNAEPAAMAQLEKIQCVALRILFSQDPTEKQAAEQEWASGHYAEIFEHITAPPDESESVNKIWRKRSEEIVTAYDKRPIIIHDQEMSEILQEQVKDISPSDEQLDITIQVMAKRIFSHQLTQDIIALQEADYLNASMFPEQYEVEFSNNPHSGNGIAWNKNKFARVELIGDIAGRGFVVKLRELESNKTVLVASGHLTGCNPFHTVVDKATKQKDSAKGDEELQSIIGSLDKVPADIKIIAIDSNVTATHPRLSLLRDANYTIDYTNYLEPTCTSPWQILDTRIDWIAIKSLDNAAAVFNIPIRGVGLNSCQTNISDHKPIAALIKVKTS